MFDNYGDDDPDPQGCLLGIALGAFMWGVLILCIVVKCSGK